MLKFNKWQSNVAGSNSNLTKIQQIGTYFFLFFLRKILIKPALFLSYFEQTYNNNNNSLIDYIKTNLTIIWTRSMVSKSVLTFDMTKYCQMQIFFQFLGRFIFICKRFIPIKLLIIFISATWNSVELAYICCIKYIKHQETNTSSHTGIFIVGAKRTPFGTFGGVFRNTSATELQTIAATAALKEAGVAPDQIDSVVVGQVMSVSATQT